MTSFLFIQKDIEKILSKLCFFFNFVMEHEPISSICECRSLDENMNSVESNEDTVQSEVQVSVVIAHCNKNSFSLPVEQISWSGLSNGVKVNLASLIVHTFSSLFYSSELGR